MFRCRPKIMSLARKIDKYRALKRIASENRHLHARLVNNCRFDASQQRTRYSIDSLAHRDVLSCSSILNTRPIGVPEKRFESNVCFRIDDRLHLSTATRTGDSREASALYALTEALCIIPSSTEWHRILKVFDSNLFASFALILRSLNATAGIDVSRRTRSQSFFGSSSLPPGNGTSSDEFKATVSVAWASIDEIDLSELSENKAILPCLQSEGELLSSSSNGKKRDFCHAPKCYDYGASGEWASCVRDAIKLALARSLDALQSQARTEWHSTGKEAALLLNELRCGGSCTTEMDVRHFDRVLNGCSLSTHTKGGRESTETETPVRWMVRSRSQTGANQGTLSIDSKESSFDASAADNSRLSVFVDVIGASTVVGSGRSEVAQNVVEHITCSVPKGLTHVSKRRFLSVTGSPSRKDEYQLSWLQDCLPGAVLMSVAAQKCALYRYGISHSRRQLCDLSRESDVGVSCIAMTPAPAISSLSWEYVPLFAALASSFTTIKLSNGGTGEGNWNGDRSDSAPGIITCSQNEWHCPDVVLMLAMVRLALNLPHSSFPDVRFEQKAVHDPARRVRDLAIGLYGDVDVFTKVLIQWATPRGTYVASAESDPACHSAGATERDATSRWLSCEDTGHQRGPLPLLVAAVCSLFDQVMGRQRSDVHHYPLVPVQSPFSRSGLDFLFYSWFGAAPQIRCFAIGTAAPKIEAASHAESLWPRDADGFTSTEVGASMTRAMLFYDLLGQRVLFAETHAHNVADAVARLDQLALEVNHISHDTYAAVSAARVRPFRSIARLQRWQGTREAFVRVATAQTSPCELDTTSRAQVQQLPSAVPSFLELRRLLRRCISSCSSELGALWTVVDLLTRVSVPTRLQDSLVANDAIDPAALLAGCIDVLTAHFEPDKLAIGTPVTAGGYGGQDEEEAELLWVGRRHVPWHRRPLGKEAAPPPAGIVELHLNMRPSADTKDTGTQDECQSRAVFRCRIDPLGNSGGSVPTGILPALTVLCREALRHAYLACWSHRHPSLSSEALPSVAELLSWCAAADPVLASAKDDFPPYDARFYAAPNLVGELLQGIAGKYSCSYAATVLPQTLAADAGCALQSSDAAPLPSTVFYRSEAAILSPREDAAEGKDGLWAANGRESAAHSAPPSVTCTLFIDSIVGSCSGGKCRGADTPKSRSGDATGSCTPTSSFILGQGVGRTKREAWRSAAWQALRLQFPQALAQVNVLRDVAELGQRPDKLNLLHQRASSSECLDSAVPERQGVVLRDVSPAFRLLWQWRTVRPLSVPGEPTSLSALHQHADAAAPARSKCTVALLCADGSRVELPAATASAASAAEAYVLAGKALLQIVHDAHRKKPVSTPANNATWGGVEPLSPMAFSSAASGTLYPSQQSSSVLYGSWRLTTHYSKSIWHAYTGALSLYFGTDMFVELLSDLHGESVGRRSGADFSRTPPSLDTLSAVQVRGCSDEHLPGVTQSAASRLGGVTGRETVRWPSGHNLKSRSGELLFRQTPAALLARHPPPSSPTSPSPSSSLSIPSCSSSPESSFGALKGISWWLRDLVEQCILPRQTKEELHGLLRGRASDMGEIQRAARWSPAERVEALMLRWTGRHAAVRVRRSPSSSALRAVWVAEVLIRIEVTHGQGDTERSGGWEATSSARGGGLEGSDSVEPGMWVAGRTVGDTSDDAVMQLYREVCDAVREVVPESPPDRTI